MVGGSQKLSLFETRAQCPKPLIPVPSILHRASRSRMCERPVGRLPLLPFGVDEPLWLKWLQQTENNVNPQREHFLAASVLRSSGLCRGLGRGHHPRSTDVACGTRRGGGSPQPGHVFCFRGDYVRASLANALLSIEPEEEGANYDIREKSHCSRLCTSTIFSSKQLLLSIVPSDFHRFVVDAIQCPIQSL